MGILPFQFTASTLTQPEKKVSPSFIISTVLLASAFTNSAVAADNDKNFPTASIIAPVNTNQVTSSEIPIELEIQDDVLKYIKDKPNVINLYKSLPVLVKSVFGDAKIRLSVFRDIEEDWSSLRIEILSDHPIEELSVLEDKLFDLIEKDSSFVAALEHVTISCS